LRLKISKRSFRSTAAGVWLPSKSEANTPQGQTLGIFLDLGTGLLGGVGAVELLTATGRDQVIAKGIFSGIAYGSIITALLSAFRTNKIQPKDAFSNLSYMVDHSVYGLVTMAVAANLGDDSVYTEKWPSSTFVRMVANNTK
jgi:hypothetical protein